VQVIVCFQAVVFAIIRALLLHHFHFHHADSSPSERSRRSRISH
jgi:hypothetical protein